MSQSNSELLDHAVAGDREALRELLSRHAEAVRDGIEEIPESWRSLLSKEDIVQETFVSAITSIKTLTTRDEGRFEGWLTKIARNHRLKAIRALKADKRDGDRKRRNQEIGNQGDEGEAYLNLFEILGGTTTSPTQAARREEAKAAINRALQSLPERHRLVLVLYDIEQRRPALKVAEILGCPSETAMLMLRNRALKEMRKFLGTWSNY